MKTHLENHGSRAPFSGWINELITEFMGGLQPVSNCQKTENTIGLAEAHTKRSDLTGRTLSEWTGMQLSADVSLSLRAEVFQNERCYKTKALKTTGAEHGLQKGPIDSESKALSEHRCTPSSRSAKETQSHSNI